MEQKTHQRRLQLVTTKGDTVPLTLDVTPTINTLVTSTHTRLSPGLNAEEPVIDINHIASGHSWIDGLGYQPEMSPNNFVIHQSLPTADLEPNSDSRPSPVFQMDE